jgi:hypothetical protein
MECARADHRRSLAKAMVAELAPMESQEVLQAAKHCAKSSIRQHRLSLMQAADVLEAAGFGGEQDDEFPSQECTSPSQVKAQLQLVQKAVDGARRQHRQSIAFAVRNLTEENRISQSPMTGSSRDRVAQIIGTALREEQCVSDGRDSSKRAPRCTPQFLTALLNTRTSEKGLPVHCGPARTPQKKKRGGC